MTIIRCSYRIILVWRGGLFNNFLFNARSSIIKSIPLQLDLKIKDLTITYAREIATTIGSSHNEVKIGYKHIQEIIQLIPEIYDEPFSDSSQLVTYLLSKFARSKVTVALSGDGGDELFGGYNRYLWSSRILSIPLKIRKIIAYTLRNISGNIFTKIEDKDILGVN